MHFASLHEQKKETTNLKTKSNQNSQKIELYGSLTTKELKKKPSSRLVGGAEGTGGKAVGWRTRVGKAAVGGGGGTSPHSCAKPRRNNWGMRPRNPGFQCGEIKSQNLWQ